MVHAQAKRNKTTLGNARKSKDSAVNEQESSIRRDQVTLASPIFSLSS